MNRPRLSLRPAIRSFILAVAAVLFLDLHATTFDLTTATVADINAAFDAGALTSEKLVQLYLNRIAAYDKNGPGIHAIVTLNEHALEQARALDAERKAKGPRSQLHGIPFVLKDLIDAAGLPTSCGFKPFGLPIPPRNATVVQKLVDAGAIVLAKVVTVNWFGNGYDETFYPGEPPHNPYNLPFDCGATSAGSGAAIGADFATLALGTDTSQSVQNPSSRCSVVGMVASYGVVSRAGVMPRSSRHDRVGPMAKSVYDVAAMLSVISGWDAEDLTTFQAIGHFPRDDWSKKLGKPSLAGVRLGVLSEMIFEGKPHEEGRAIFAQAVADLKKAGAIIVDPITVGADLKVITDSKYLRLAEYEKIEQSNAYLARYGDAAPFKSIQDMIAKVGPEKFSKGMVEALNFPPPDKSPDYLARYRAVEALAKLLNDTLERYHLDGFVLPFATIGAQPLKGGGYGNSAGAGSNISSYSSLPSVIVPGGYTPSENLPIGIQFIGKSYDDMKLLQVALGYEQATHRRKLPDTTPALAGEHFDY